MNLCFHSTLIKSILFASPEAIISFLTTSHQILISVSLPLIPWTCETSLTPMEVVSDHLTWANHLKLCSLNFSSVGATYVSSDVLILTFILSSNSTHPSSICNCTMFSQTSYQIFIAQHLALYKIKNKNKEEEREKSYPRISVSIFQISNKTWRWLTGNNLKLNSIMDVNGWDYTNLPQPTPICVW